MRGIAGKGGNRSRLAENPELNLIKVNTTKDVESEQSGKGVEKGTEVLVVGGK